MLQCALVGIGRLGRVHYQNLLRLQERNQNFRLVAICDIDEAKLSGKHSARANVETSPSKSLDLSAYRLYTDYAEMLREEALDFVVLAIPTDLHAPFCVQALEKGVCVFCEKPMAHNAAAARQMLDAQKNSGKQLMIGQCLRFWREYLFLKETVEQKTYGAVNSAHFWRGGYQDHVANPSYENWILKKERGGGGLYDQHIHDSDLVLWLFGEPDGVFTRGKTVFPGSADDVMLTSYLYDDKVVTARDDTACKGVPFSYGYDVALEEATLRFDSGDLRVWQAHKEPFTPDLSDYTPYPSAYESEMAYFISRVEKDQPIERATPAEAYATIELIEAEARSAASGKIER